VFGDRPFFLTMTETVSPPATRHVDVSLWFALAGRVGQTLHPDQREFVEVRWWTVAKLRHAGLDRFGLLTELREVFSQFSGHVV